MCEVNLVSSGMVYYCLVTLNVAMVLVNCGLVWVGVMWYGIVYCSLVLFVLACCRFLVVV